MAALILLSDYRMKKDKNLALKESQAPVDLKTMREFRSEMLSRFSSQDEQFKQIWARFDQVDAKFVEIDARFDQVDAKFVRLEAKIDQHMADMKTMFHQLMLVVEEQNLRNKQAYDGYTVMYEALYELKNQIKPECFK